MKREKRPFYLLMILIMTLIFSFAFNSPKVMSEINPDALAGRTYKVYLPGDYERKKDTTKWPLIILLHGFKASGFLQNVYLGLSHYVTSDQFILVVPDGVKNKDGNRFWNATPFCCDLYGQGIDDVSFLRELMAKMSHDYSVDKQNIFFFGHSNGGFMANRLACEFPEKIKGVITIAGTGLVNGCKNPAPLNVLHVHGTDDETILYAGRPGLYPGAVEHIDEWKKRNGCSDIIDSVAKRDLTFDWSLETEVSSWQQCSSGKRVVLLKIEGASHIPKFKSGFLKEVFSFIQDVR